MKTLKENTIGIKCNLESPNPLSEVLSLSKDNSKLVRQQQIVSLLLSLGIHRLGAAQQLPEGVGKAKVRPLGAPKLFA